MKGKLLSSLFTITEGQGAPLLVLHGWGMNHRVWERIRPGLIAHWQVTWVDLPGHGHSHALPMGDFDELLEELAPLLQPETVIIGWSMGGLLAQGLARRFPQRVKALMLIASTPCFVQRPEWPHGLAESVLDTFASNLQQDYSATVRRFFALQFMGVRHDPSALQALRERVLALPASVSALARGLELLKQTDMTAVPTTVPCLWVFGRLDKLIPVSLADALAERAAAAGSGSIRQQIVVLPKAAHVPFVTHPEDVLQSVTAFLAQLGEAP